MKTFRIALTATMLLSLHATSFCMESTEKPALTRTLSHDGTRKVLTGYSGGLFGSGIDTLNKLGQEYAPGYVYALGSDDQAQSRWENVGKHDIKTLEHAQKYITAVKAKGWNMSADALQPSRDLIKADRNNKREQSITYFNKLNEQGLQLIYACAEKQKQKDSYTPLDLQDLEDLTNLQELQAQARAHKDLHNATYRKNLITTPINIQSMDRTTSETYKKQIEYLGKLHSKK